MLAHLKVLGLFMFMFTLMSLIGWVLGTYYDTSPTGTMALFFGIALLFNLVSFLWADKLVLRTYKARIVTGQEGGQAARLVSIVKRLSQQAELPLPRVAIIPTDNPNAFATGRSPKKAVVAATQGILELLDDRELEGVMAHELSHVRHRDMLVMTVAATMAMAISFAARILFWNSLFGGNRNRNVHPLVLLAVWLTVPIAALLVQMAISRTREFKADAGGARLCGNPLALASALEKLDIGGRRRPIQMGSPATAALFIANPFHDRSLVTGLFLTHPPMDQRIARLRELVLYNQ